jgi:hypothetical protein
MESIIMYVCFGDPGPKRIYFAFDLTLLIFMFMIWGYVIKTLKANHRTLLSLIAGISFILVHVPFINQVPESIEYSKAAQNRDEIVTNANKGETIHLLELPESHLILSYFSNDIIWIENVYLPYFNKNNKVVLINNN